MSYDLDAFPLPPGVSADAFMESGGRERLAEDDSPPSAEERAAMERAAEALLAVDPAAERADGDDWIEINGEAMQVSLYAREAAISIPYWGGDADAVMARAFEYARVLDQTLGYTVWDPQTGSVVDLGAPDRGAAASIFSDISGRMDEIADTSPPQSPRRPWWKIWG
jgi:hypothetical protein